MATQHLNKHQRQSICPFEHMLCFTFICHCLNIFGSLSGTNSWAKADGLSLDDHVSCTNQGGGGVQTTASMLDSGRAIALILIPFSAIVVMHEPPCVDVGRPVAHAPALVPTSGGTSVLDWARNLQDDESHPERGTLYV